MERLLVFADFNWLEKPELVGELCYEKLRGSDSYAFKFDENWLKVHAGINLSEDINNYPGVQYTKPGNVIFGCQNKTMCCLRKKWIAQLIQPGTSLGGARPKAGVLDEKGNLCIAKFPSRKDDYDTGLWEHFSHLLAQKAGIQAAQTRTLGGLGKYHTLLSRRFDRTDEAKRIHFASSMSLLGLKDGDNAQGGYGYLDIVDFILQGCCNVEKNLQELYRRVAFNICIGNSDDHFRNHGFLLTPKGWTLSPAYDMNPTLNEYQSLLINESSNKADIHVLLDSCESYMIKREEAENIIQEVQTAVDLWENLAIQLQIPAREMAMFKERFKLNL